MKALTIHNTKNYPDYNVYISGNSFGDQCYVLIYEHKDGSKETIYTVTNHEGSHESADMITERCYRLVKKHQAERLSKAWTKIVDALTFKQLNKTMGIRNYKAKALFVRDHVSKSKTIQSLCADLIWTYDSIFSLKAVSNE